MWELAFGKNGLLKISEDLAFCSAPWGPFRGCGRSVAAVAHHFILVEVNCYSSVVSDALVTSWTVARQASLLPGVSRQEWVTIFFSRESSQPRDQTCISCIGRWTLPLSHQGRPVEVNGRCQFVGDRTLRTPRERASRGDWRRMTTDVGGSQWVVASEKPKVESFKKEG